MPSQLDRCEQALRKRLDAFGFSAIGPVADRHDVLQLTFVRQARDRNLYIVFGESNGDSDYLATVDTVIERGDELVRTRVATISSPGELTAAAERVATSAAESLSEPIEAESARSRV